MSKKVILFILIILIGLGSYYFFVFNKKTDYILKAPIDITFAPKWVNQAQFAGEFVAKDLGYYQKLGLGVTIKEFNPGGSVMGDLEAGTAQLGLMSANEFLVYKSQGKPIKAVAAFFQTSPMVIISLKSNPVTTPAELTGKRLGLTGGVGGEGSFVYQVLLSSVGRSIKNENIVPLSFAQSEQEHLTLGLADTVDAYRDVLYGFERDGVAYQVIYPEQYGSALYNDVLVTTDDFLAEHPDAVRAFLKATIDGWTYAHAHQESAIATTLKYVTHPQYKDIDYERYILKETEGLMTANNSVAIGTMDLSHWQKFYDDLYLRGFFIKPFDITTAFTNNYLPK